MVTQPPVTQEPSKSSSGSFGYRGCWVTIQVIQYEMPVLFA